MISYILEVNLCWLVFLVLYYLGLRKETFFNWNRFYLLGALVLGLIIPMIDLQALWPNPNVGIAQDIIVPVTTGVRAIEVTVYSNVPSQGIQPQQVLWFAYIVGMLGMFFYFSKGLSCIWKLYRNGERQAQKGVQVILTNEPHVAFSFFQLLFKSKLFQLNPKEEAHLLAHELAHIRGWHSLDVLFMEGLKILFWWSPLVYFYRNAMLDVHEYIADEAVLKSASRKSYGKFLIKQSQSGPSIALANNLIQSQLKKRILMMMKRKSTFTATLKYLMVVPLCALAMMAFSLNLNSEAITPAKEAVTDVDQYPRFPGCEDQATDEAKDACSKKKLIEYIVGQMKYPKAAKEQGIEGKVFISFVVRKDGQIDQVTIKKDLAGGCGEVAKGIVSNMPNWIPGTKDGQAVDVEMTLPFSFALPKGEKTNASADDKVYKEADEMPVFPGCVVEGNTPEEIKACSDKGLLEFVYYNIKYPKDARDRAIEGMVVVSFVVNKDGRVIDPKVERSLFQSCDDAVMSVVKRMVAKPEPWTPGKLDGKAVSVQYMLPVKFKLVGEDKDNLLLTLKDFSIAPNPSNGQFRVQFESEAMQSNVLVTDLSGRQVFNQEYNFEGGVFSFDLDLGNQTPGAYILTVKQGKKAYSEKIIIKN